MLVERPIVLLTTEEAAWLVLMFDGGLDDVRSSRVTVPDRVWRMVTELRRAADLHRAGASVASGTSATPTDHDPSSSSVTHVLTTQEAAEVLKMSDRGVRAALDAGRLTGRRRGRQWMVAKWSVMEALERKVNECQ